MVVVVVVGGRLSKRSPPTHPKKERIFINTVGGRYSRLYLWYAAVMNIKE